MVCCMVAKDRRRRLYELWFACTNLCCLLRKNVEASANVYIVLLLKITIKLMTCLEKRRGQNKAYKNTAALNSPTPRCPSIFFTVSEVPRGLPETINLVY